AQELGVDAFKLHTSELSNPEMIDKVAETGKRIDLSIGASSLDEIQKALTRIRSLSEAEIWLMYGYQNFPTDPRDVNLSYLQTLRDLFGLRVGYQDHTDADGQGAFWLPACAHGMGIDIQEKHITHDRSKKGCDHQAALNPDEFADFVGMVKLLDAAEGVPHSRSFTEGEQKYRQYAKKSMVAARPIKKGATVQAADLKPMRASELGVPPDESHRLIGQIAAHDIETYELVTETEVGQ
ncbi:N-acetylneuraminate synthase family protein, partial [Akkermansiaceae bacterium]|nr:N-acetylneuraminate synthase family protein [Akkermansiaceae bacterium]